MFLSIPEILDMIITTIAAGFVFMDMFKRPGWEAESFANKLVFSSLVATPAIILHEFGHKFVALGFGYQATFHAAYLWLGLGILLKLLNFPFLIIVPAYVSIIGASGTNTAAIAFAGPAVNGILFITGWLLLKYGTWSRTTEAVLFYTKNINMFLFIFNLLPLPGFDGLSVFTNLI